MRYSVCIIDNDIPAAGEHAQALKIKDSELLNPSNLQLLIAKETWNDPVIKNLTNTLLEQKDGDGISSKWEVYGFTNPSFYINTINNGFFRSDIVVFDWEFPGGQAGARLDSESLLKEILTRTFSLVFIFSKADKQTEIESILAKPEFQEFKERLQYLDKTVAGVDQTRALLQKAEEMYANNFSFRFASILRKKAVQCTDKILSDMGRASLNDVKNQVLIGDGGKKDFIDFLAERFRTAIAEKDVHELVDAIPEPGAGAAPPDASLAAKVWAYRLYFHSETGDELVRRGDIVKVGGLFCLVLSADCDLVRFWKKNLGIINMVALHELNQANSELKKWLTLCVKPENIPHKISSLLGKIGHLSEGPFVLPFVPVGAGIKHFVAMPKELMSTRITLPAGWTNFTHAQKNDDPMKYSYWPGSERICTVSEPFLTPVIQHIFNTMGGQGVPDYPDQMQDILKKVLQDFTAAAAVQAAEPAAAARAPAALPDPAAAPASETVSGSGPASIAS
jgi:hypothetical protein